MRVIKIVASSGRWFRLLCLLAAALTLAGWTLEMRQTDRVGGSAGLWFVVFVVLGLVGGPMRALRTRTMWFRWSRAPQPADDRAISIGTPAFRPDRLAWLLPAALAVPMLATVPLYFEHHPGEWTVLLDLALYVVLLGYGGLAIGVVVWLIVLLPALLVLGVTATHSEGDGYERMLLAGRAMIGIIVTIAVGITVAKLTR